MRFFHSLKLTMCVVVSLIIGTELAVAAGWGSIALSTSTGAFGISNNWGSRAQARATALRLCRRQGAGDCRIKTDFTGCGAIATDPDAIAYGIGTASSAYQAKRNAIRRCSQNIPSGCYDAQVLCN